MCPPLVHEVLLLGAPRQPTRAAAGLWLCLASLIWAPCHWALPSVLGRPLLQCRLAASGCRDSSSREGRPGQAAAIDTVLEGTQSLRVNLGILEARRPLL